MSDNLSYEPQGQSSPGSGPGEGMASPPPKKKRRGSEKRQRR
jgi:hypothetical protein